MKPGIGKYNAGRVNLDTLVVGISAVLQIESEILRIDVGMVCALRYEEVYATQARIEKSVVCRVRPIPVGFEPEAHGACFAYEVGNLDVVVHTIKIDTPIQLPRRPFGTSFKNTMVVIATRVPGSGTGSFIQPPIADKTGLSSVGYAC
ncbi:hypothetical protein ES703_121009 [subsurface metagenome]